MTGKIFRSCFLVGLAVMILCTGLFVAVMASQYEEEVYQQLQEELAYVKHGMEESGQAYLTGLRTTQRLTWVDTDGTVLNFAMNDKCAAGTGRFFEAMAKAFEMDLTEFSNLSLQAKNVIPITAQCTVFAESEVISLVGEGKPMDEIAAGIELSVAKRCFVMAKKAGAVDKITLTGGCAKNEGLKQAIQKVLKLKVIDLPVDPQLIGAIGAAEFARQKGLAQG